jgi:hypothetical protein
MRASLVPNAPGSIYASKRIGTIVVLPGLAGASGRKRETSMSEMEQARNAEGSGKPFTTAVVLAIIICVALLVWRFFL